MTLLERLANGAREAVDYIRDNHKDAHRDDWDDPDAKDICENLESLIAEAEGK